MKYRICGRIFHDSDGTKLITIIKEHEEDCKSCYYYDRCDGNHAPDKEAGHCRGIMRDCGVDVKFHLREDFEHLK